MTTAESNSDRRSRNQLGFTLVELSIGLVIIALLVAGIVVGTAMIDASKQRGVIKEVEAINVATTTFKMKYGGLPGDMSQALQFGIPMHSCSA